MKCIRIFTIFIIFLMSINQLISAETLTVTLENALEIALKNNTQIKQYESDAKIAEAQYSQTVGDFWMPDITLNAGANYIDSTTIEGSIIDTPGNISTSGGFPPQITIETNKITNAFFDNYSIGLGVSKPLFAGFKLWNSMELKKMNLEIAKLRLKDKQNEVGSAIKILFYNLFLIKENVHLTEELVSHFKERYNETITNFKGGYISEYDKIKAEVQYKAYIPKLLKLNSASSLAKNALCEQLSFDNDAVEFIGNFLNITNFLEMNTPFDKALSNALSNNITYKAIDYSIDMAKLNKKMTEGSRLPIVSAYFNYKYDLKKEHYMDNDRKWLPGWNTGLQLIMPLDDWIPISKTENSIKEAQDNIEKMEWLKKQTADTITFQIKNLLEQLSNGNNIIESQRDIKNQAQWGFELSKKRYKSGASPSVEVNDMEASYYQANILYLQAIYEEYTNIIVLKRILNE